MDLPTEMQHQAMGYDRAATMFSPDGHLLQVEYAEKTVRLGSSSIGLVCSDGVLIVADKRIRDKLLAPESTSKIFEIDSHIIASSAGILADARILVDQAQVLAQQHRVVYGGEIQPVSVIRMIADKMQLYTQYGGARPFGVSVMLAGTHRGKGYLYSSDVTGNFFTYKAITAAESGIDSYSVQQARLFLSYADQDFKDGHLTPSSMARYYFAQAILLHLASDYTNNGPERKRFSRRAFNADQMQRSLQLDLFLSCPKV